MMITFQRYPETNLYLLPQGPQSDKGFFAFLLTVPVEHTPTFINILESWEDYTGYYLFLREKPADSGMAAFAAAAESYFQDKVPSHTSFAWAHYDEGSKQVGGADIIGIAKQGEETVVETEVTIFFRKYGLPFKKDTPVQLAGGAGGGPNEFLFTYPPFAASPPPVASRGIHLPLAGEGRGCFEGQVVIGDFSDDFREGWDVGLRYCLSAEGNDVSQRYPVFNLETGRQALFEMRWDPVDHGNGDRSYLAFTDLSFLLVKDAQDPSQFSIEPTAKPGVYPSHFRTIYGERVGLRPLTKSVSPLRPAKLVFSSYPASLPDGSVGEQYCLAPSGDFELQVLPEVEALASAASQVPYDLLCGLSGTESLRFVAGSHDIEGNILSFFPGKAAYAPVYPVFGQGSQNQSAGGPGGNLLTDKYKTSWVSVALSPTTGGAIYYSQPADAPLYSGNGAQLDAETNPILTPFQSPAAQLPLPDRDNCFPMAPLAGAVLNLAVAQADTRFLSRFETQILNPVRRATIAGLKNSAPIYIEAKEPSTGPQMSTTPQGLLVEVDQNKWSKLLLAAANKVKGVAGPALRFNNLNPTLQAAFQTSELFLVVTWDKYLKEDGTTFDHTIYIEGWPFMLDVSQSTVGSYKNVLIFKFCSGKVIDRIKDPKSWTNPTGFNQSGYNDLAFLSAQLAGYVQKGIDRAAGDDAYQHFKEIVTTDGWNGILALNVSIGLEEFPPALRALLAGIDLDKFAAHHFGVDANFADFKASPSQMPPVESSLFALIDYEDAEYQRASRAELSARQFPQVFSRRALATVTAEDDGGSSSTSQDYAFKVLSLKVQFANTEIKRFDSLVRLTFNTLFGEAVDGKIVDDKQVQDNNILLRGTYENYSGNSSYVFNLVDDTVFLLKSKVLKSCEILKATFYSVVPDSSQSMDANSASNYLVLCNFVFWGNLSFHVLSESENAEKAQFDIFSFDNLSYSNLVLSMSFYMYDPSNTAFHFETRQMAFDLSRSAARDNSLFKNFPLQIKALTYGQDNQKPSDLGFASIMTPINIGTVGEKWFALEYNLNLGSPGALAEKIGFTSSLLTSWSPNPDALSADVAIKLPGSNSKGPLSLQGVLKLAADYYQFVTYSAASAQPKTRGKAKSTAAEKTGYMLLFRNFGLTLLGMKIPPNIAADVFLFGDPDPKVTPDSLGWYAGYKRPTEEPSTKEALPAARRAAKKPATKKTATKKTATKKTATKKAAKKISGEAEKAKRPTKPKESTKKKPGPAALKQAGKSSSNKTGSKKSASKKGSDKKAGKPKKPA